MNAPSPFFCLFLLAASSFPPLLALLCPTSCANIPNVAKPFGAAPNCSSPGFTLDCDHPKAQWSLNAVVFDVLGIQYNGSYGYLDLTWAEDKQHSQPSCCTSCDCAHPDLHSCDLLDGVNLPSFTQASLSLSRSTVYLLFGCNEYVSGDPRISTDCQKFDNVSGWTQDHPEADNATGCVRFRRDMQEPDLERILDLYSCAGYISFVTSEGSVSYRGSSIQLSWTETCDACNGGDCIGSLCSRLSKALTLGVLPAAVLVSIVVLYAYVVWKRKKIFSQRASGCSAPNFATGRGKSFAAQSASVKKIFSQRASGGSAPNFATGRGKSFAAQFASVAPQEFTFKELDDATESFSDGRLLGDGGFGAVYEGRLYDGRIVAVKRLYHDNFRGMEQFCNELRIISSLAHPNLVKLYGYCCEDQRDLLLVFEYVSNGTLADHLHNRRAETLPWKIRLKIALETAQALSYLHNATTTPILHRDVKSHNILLDQDFHAKLADFGLSRFLPLHASHISTTPQGTPGYLDPDYRQCYQLTDKSDVYSFGVVLVELVSGLPAVDMSRKRGEINLSSLAMSKIACAAWQELLDPRLDVHREPHMVDMARSVMELAFRCLVDERENRPSTKEVLKELDTIWQCGYGEFYVRFSENVLFAANQSSALLKHRDEFSPTSVHAPWPSSSTVSCSSSGSFPSS